MTRPVCLLLFALAGGSLFPVHAGDDVVFRSDVSLARVDAQVVARENRAVTGLNLEDFVLRENGRPQPIRNFASENMPVDVLLLLDVSASMRPHVERIASAARQAFGVLGSDDRIAIMVFDRSSRLRLPFQTNRAEVIREFDRLLDHESFRGGTDITRGLLDAAAYVGKQGRRDARRAIVILTDDQTGGSRDEEAVSRALVRADAVLSALIAPDAMRNRRYGHGGGGGWPGRGGPMGGGVIWPRRGGGPYGGPGGGMGPHTHSAGTSEIARGSGGDSMPVSDASALETTLARLRQRYALYFHSTQGAGGPLGVQVDLADAARRRYPDAEIRYRRVYLTGDAGDTAAPIMITRAPLHMPPQPSTPEVSSVAATGSRRRVAVDEPVGPRGPSLSPDSTTTTTTPATPAPAAPPASATPAPVAPPAPAPSGGWRKLKPGEQP
ncbi:MAG TPA: VWA domain-containing protein [Bryobacteraceae bacterium]|nr:VWA domain-containing protein [Bryobacteraceae bacterium]